MAQISIYQIKEGQQVMNSLVKQAETNKEYVHDVKKTNDGVEYYNGSDELVLSIPVMKTETP